MFYYGLLIDYGFNMVFLKINLTYSILKANMWGQSLATHITVIQAKINIMNITQGP